MSTRKKRCETCPFRSTSIDADELIECASVPPEYWACHTEDYPGGGNSGIQCKGHHSARLKVTRMIGTEALNEKEQEWLSRPPAEI